MVSHAITTTKIDYLPCRYGAARLVFRGPQKSLDAPYVALLGGSETYGKFVATPFADRLEELTGRTVVNLGAMHAGPSVILNEPDVLRVARDAETAIIQVMGTANISNRFYTVHPRRNDRFLGASRQLAALFPEIDFTEFNFTGHLLRTLSRVSPDAFAEVEAELREAWLARMRSILAKLPRDRWLLWMSERRPDEPAGLGDADPLFVTRRMLDDLAAEGAGVIEVVASPAARAEGLSGKIYDDIERHAAEALPGPLFHDEAAVAIARALDGRGRGPSPATAPRAVGIPPNVRASRSAPAPR